MGAVADAVDSLMSQLTSVSTSQSSATTSLVNSAQSALAQLAPPGVNLRLNLQSRVNVPSTRAPQPPDVEVEAYVKPAEIPLDPLQPLTDAFTTEPPELDLPEIEWGGAYTGGLPEDTDYSYHRGDMDYTTQELTTVVSDEPSTLPPLTTPKLFTTEALEGEPPNVPAPDFGAFVLDYQTPYQQSLDEVKGKIVSLHQALETTKAAFDPGDEHFLSLLRGAMDNSRWSLPYAEWAGEVKDKEFQSLYSERYDAIKALDNQPPSVTGMPTGQQLAGAVGIEATTARKELEVLQKIEESLRDKEFEFYKLALSLGANITEAAFSLRFQQIDLMQRAQRLVLAVADDLISLITRLIENKEREFDYYIRYNDAQIARNKLSMEIEKTKLESIRTELGVNELLLTYNENNTKVYSLVMRLLEQRIDKKKIENAHLIYKKDVELLQLEYFNVELEQYKENLRLFMAKQGDASADIRENAVILEGEILKSKRYISELTQQLANYKVEILNSKVASSTDRLTLDMYSEKNRGLVAELEALEDVSRIAVKAIMAGVEAESFEKNLESQQQDLEDQNTLYKLRRDLKIKQLDLLNDLKQFSLNTERVRKQADIMVQGASVAGGMATQAFAGLNGVATRIMTEFA
jgi:hypothetical protein